jgi:hypothetical protein
MSAIPEDLLKIARRCADKLTLSKRGSLPPLEDIDAECEDDIEELLSVLQDDEIFGQVDLNAQQNLMDRIEAALPEDSRPLLAELAELQLRHVWMQQEAAYHLGLAVGMKFAGQAGAADDEDEDEDEDENGDEDDTTDDGEFGEEG